jgi:hypothetical protein
MSWVSWQENIILDQNQELGQRTNTQSSMHNRLRSDQDLQGQNIDNPETGNQNLGPTAKKPEYETSHQIMV